MSDCTDARGPAHEDKAELPSHPLERANDHRKDLHSGHLCPGLVGGWNRGGGEKERQVEGRWEARREGVGGEGEPPSLA